MEQKNMQPNETQNIQQLSNLWMASKTEKVKPSTYQKYDYLLRKYILPVCGTQSLQTLDTPTMDAAMRKIYQQPDGIHLSASLMRGILFVMRSILFYGKRLGLLPTVDITFQFRDTASHEIQILSARATKCLVSYTEEHPSTAALAAMMSLYTGMRLGELCALKQEDIDFENNVIHVRHTAQRLKTSTNGKTELILTLPKSQKSLRDIPLLKPLADVLAAYGIPAMESTEYFVLGNQKTPYEPRTLQYGYRRILAACQIENSHFHCLRHTFATNCIKAGFDVKTLSEILGHANVSFTMNCYVHTDLEEKRRQMEQLSVFLEGVCL